MPAPMTNKLCARCDRKLGATNTNPDNLCGKCQADIAPHHPESRLYKEWVARGRQRELHRAPSGRPRPLTIHGVEAGVAASGIMCPPLVDMRLEDLMKHMGKLKGRLSEVNNELIKRRRDLQRLVASLDDEIPPGGIEVSRDG